MEPGADISQPDGPQFPEVPSADLAPVFVAMAKYFSLLAEPTRLMILSTICRQELSVSAIVAATGASQTNVSRHLAQLYQAGLVSRRRHRNAVFYKVAEPEFAEVCGTVCKQLASRIDDRQPLREQLQQFASQH